jgi:hypothetical protein
MTAANIAARRRKATQPRARLQWRRSPRAGGGSRATPRFWPRLAPRLKFNEHIEANGPTVFARPCKMGIIRTRRERPRGRAADERDELSPFHCQCFPCFRCKG